MLLSLQFNMFFHPFGVTSGAQFLVLAGRHNVEYFKPDNASSNDVAGFDNVEDDKAGFVWTHGYDLVTSGS